MKKLFILILFALVSFSTYSQNAQRGEVILIDGWFKVGNDTISYDQFKTLWLEWKQGYYTQSQINDTLGSYALKTTAIDVTFSRDLDAGDVGNILRITGAYNVTIPLNFSSMSIGETIVLLNPNTLGTDIEVIPDGGVTLNGGAVSVSLLGNYTSAVIVKTGSNTYEIY